MQHSPIHVVHDARARDMRPIQWNLSTPVMYAAENAVAEAGNERG